MPLCSLESEENSLRPMQFVSKMKNFVLLFVGLLCAFNTHAQLLATSEDAENALKVVMTCSKYTINENDNIQEYADAQVTIQQSKKSYSISAPAIQGFFELNQNEYLKKISNESIEHNYVLFRKQEAESNPSFLYHTEIGDSGIVNGVFSIYLQNRIISFYVDKCVFVTNDGMPRNYYCDRAHSLNSDILASFFEAIKKKKKKK